MSVKPKFEKLDPAFIGTAKVLKSINRGNPDEDFYIVQLDTGICDCRWGNPFKYDPKKEKMIEAQYCVHKLKALSDIVSKNPELTWPYVKALSTRYSRFEVVSAFHKELRRGDLKKAIFWGSILMRFRGAKGVVKYMLNIIYEETRDHRLHKYLLQTFAKDKLEIAELWKCIELFCYSKKKWELPGRLDIFYSEMNGYKSLAKKYGYEIAKARDIIPEDQNHRLREILNRGVKAQALDSVQYGLKGLFKSCSLDHDAHKLWLLEIVDSLALDDDKYTAKFVSLINRRIEVTDNVGYHEINAYMDLIMGEPYEAGLLPRSKLKAILRRPGASKLALGVAPQIPLYAHDNHTWFGKSLLKRYPHEYGAGADQESMDLRWCGAYLGVAWRYLAYDQHGTCEVKWGEVKWPKWLWAHCSKMFY